MANKQSTTRQQRRAAARAAQKQNGKAPPEAIPDAALTGDVTIPAEQADPSAEDPNRGGVIIPISYEGGAVNLGNPSTIGATRPSEILMTLETILVSYRKQAGLPVHGLAD